VRTRKTPLVWELAAVFSAIVALAMLAAWAPEFMARVQDPEMMTMNPEASSPNTSKGLVMDGAAPEPATDKATSHARGKEPTSSDTTTFTEKIVAQ
jgi:hypothetical protein